MRDDIGTILVRVGECLAVALFFAGIVGLIYIDEIYNQNVRESYVEFGQEALILLTTAIFTTFAVRKRVGGLWLVAGFFGCMLIREFDGYLDLISHGAWKYFALAFAGFFSYQAYRLGKENTLASLVAFMKTRAYTFIFIGLIIVLVFSRLFGMSELWQAALGDHFTRSVKNLAEEGTELLGYALIFWGALNYLFTSEKNPH